jgi:hypothetical protein
MRNTRFLRTAIIAFTICIISLAGRGRVFAAPSESVLWSFDYTVGSTEGSIPYGGLIELGGKL